MINTYVGQHKPVLVQCAIYAASSRVEVKICSCYYIFSPQVGLYNGVNIYAVTLSALNWVINRQLTLSIVADVKMKPYDGALVETMLPVDDLVYFAECSVVQHYHSYLVIHLHTHP